MRISATPANPQRNFPAALYVCLPSMSRCRPRQKGEMHGREMYGKEPTYTEGREGEGRYTVGTRGETGEEDPHRSPREIGRDEQLDVPTAGKISRRTKARIYIASPLPFPLNLPLPSPPLPSPRVEGRCNLPKYSTVPQTPRRTLSLSMKN